MRLLRVLRSVGFIGAAVIGAVVIAAATTIVAAPAGAQSLSCSVQNTRDGVVLVSWNDIGASGYDVIEDNQPKRWVTRTTYEDTSPGASYKIVAFGNGTDWTTTTCTNPRTTLRCSLTRQNGTATLQWTNIGARGYDVIEDNQPKRWVTGTSYRDTSPGSEYRIIAFGNGTDWTRARCIEDDPGPDGPDPDETVTVLAAGDIGLCDSTHAPKVGEYVESRTDAYFLALGDLAYPDGSARNFAECYDPYFKHAKSRTLPVVGNHEYYTRNASGYVDYFGAAAGPADKLYYSKDVGNWHIVVLNADCWEVGGCGTSSPQYRWLQNDLAQNNKSCILAAWHHAYYTSESDGDADYMKDFYKLLDDEGADLLLTGHSHNYERFHRMNAYGGVRSSGIRNFVVGTGGTGQRPFTQVENGSVVRNTGTWGVLELDLAPNSYTWEFKRTSGTSFSDTGQASC